MPIPELDHATGNLPPGIHDAGWDDIVKALGFTDHRRALLDGLLRALHALRSGGCSRAYVDGSFATSKETPGDFDGCWEARGVDPDKLDPVLLDFTNARATQKDKYGGELFIASSAATPSGTAFLDFFQTDRTTGDAKGIIAVDLGGLP